MLKEVRHKGRTYLLAACSSGGARAVVRLALSAPELGVLCAQAPPGPFLKRVRVGGARCADAGRRSGMTARQPRLAPGRSPPEPWSPRGSADSTPGAGSCRVWVRVPAEPGPHGTSDAGFKWRALLRALDPRPDPTPLNIAISISVIWLC